MAAGNRVREDATARFEFLREVVKLRSKAVRSLDKYADDGEVLWLADTPRGPGCSCAAWSGEDAAATSTWLEVSRPDLTEPPPPPEALRPWLKPRDLADSSLDFPDLEDSVPEGQKAAARDHVGRFCSERDMTPTRAVQALRRRGSAVAAKSLKSTP